MTDLKDMLSDLIGRDVVIKKVDGYTWTGRLKGIRGNKIVLKNPDHGTSVVSWDQITNVYSKEEDDNNA